MQVLEVMMPQKNDSREAFQRWARRVMDEHGHDRGSLILKSLIEECGGLRLRLPDLQDIYRDERDRYIRAKFSGDPRQYEEFAINFNLHIRQVRRIIHDS